ncbi:Na+/H+ antiporter NhaC family protein [Peribacillus loiseleuriae]|uniref:Na+/H+ antiporter NhaC family protein n=1 Tax=Peribacillus loiseleuriae TaxID=1679170 RepID=UPI00382DF01B
MKTEGNVKGLFPLILFLIIFIGSGIITGDFNKMPLLLGFMISAGFALFLNRQGEKAPVSKKIDIFLKGAGEPSIMLILVIFLLAGAFYSVAEATGAVESTVNLGLSILPKNLILPGLFIIGCIISFSMGTSIGTITALAPIAIGISQQADINLPLVLGTVVGGAMFGDNLSFVSDTTIVATRSQGVELRDKFRMNGLIVLPAVVLTVIILLFFSSGNATVEIGEYSIVKVLPYLSIIIFALIGINVMGVLVLGILTSSIIGLASSSYTFMELLGHIQTGMGWMEDIAIIAIITGGIVGLMNYYGGIQFLLETLTSRIKTKKGGEAGISALVSAVDLSTANNTISIITAGPLAKEITEKYDIDPRRTASLLDIFSSAFQGILPYGSQILICAGLAQISPVQIVPYSFYSILMLVFGSLAIAFGIPKFKRVPTRENISEAKEV